MAIGEKIETIPSNGHARIDQARVEAFSGKVFGDTVGLMVTTMASIGDRLGLFKSLAREGPATAAELAARTGTQERYVREWLGAMAAAGYVALDVERDSEGSRYSLPPEHAPVLVDEAGPAFFGGVHEEMVALVGLTERIVEVFRKGGGIQYDDFPDSMYEGIERFTAGWFQNLLVQAWIPAIPDLSARLEQGIRVADVGCGRGRALVRLAREYPESRYVGYDLYGPNVDRATALARAAGVSDRVAFRQGDVADGLPEPYDLITAFDVIHDAANPLGLLTEIRKGLRPDGVFLCLEINCADRPEHNVGPVGALFYGCSVLLCTTVSLSEGGAGLGTLGLPEARLRSLAEQAGFGSLRRVPVDNPFNVLYEVRP